MLGEMKPLKTVKPLTRTRETPTRKMWGRGLTSTGWPGLPQGYLCYSLNLHVVSIVIMNNQKKMHLGHYPRLHLPYPFAAAPDFSIHKYSTFNYLLV